MVEKGTRGAICHSIHQYARVNNKYLKDYNKNKELPNLKYWVIISLRLVNVVKIASECI